MTQKTQSEEGEENVEIPKNADSDLLSGGVSSRSISISASLEAISNTYLLPSSIVKVDFVKAGSFVAGYVAESTGSKETPPALDASPSSIRSGAARRGFKKQKLNKSQRHALFLADEKSMVKV